MAGCSERMHACLSTFTHRALARTPLAFVLSASVLWECCSEVFRIAADIRHLLSALRRCRGLRRLGDRTHSPDGEEGGAGEEESYPAAPPTGDHLRVLAAGQAALESMDNWMLRQVRTRWERA
jgi:hypothetical protein